MGQGQVEGHGGRRRTKGTVYVALWIDLGQRGRTAMRSGLGTSRDRAKGARLGIGGSCFDGIPMVVVPERYGEPTRCTRVFCRC